MFYTDHYYPPERLGEYARLVSSSKPYIVLFASRSGSTYLMDMLYKTGKAGRVPARESEPFYFYDRLLDVLKERGVPSPGMLEHMLWLVQNYRTPNGAFGIKACYSHIADLMEMGLFDLFFSRFSLFYLRRRNILRQAVSFYLAERTNYWHTFTPAEQADPNCLPPVAYDGTAIFEEIKKLRREESGVENYLRTRRLECPRFEYEQVKRDPAQVVGAILHTIGETLPPDFVPASDLRKVSTGRNEEFAEAFRRDRALVARLASIGVDESRLYDQA